MDAQEIQDLEEMFGTNGWRRFTKDAQEAIREREQAALAARSFEEVRFYQGEVAQLSIIVSLQDAVKIMKQHELDNVDSD